MHETEPFNDVTPPCPDCGEVAIPCECGKPIETVAQLQRALEAAGVIDAELRRSGRLWHVLLDAPGPKCATGCAHTIAEAFGSALDDWPLTRGRP